VAFAPIGEHHLPTRPRRSVTSDRLLMILTCGGEFDREIGHHRDSTDVCTGPLTG
jgi:hypothetical protein